MSAGFRVPAAEHHVGDGRLRKAALRRRACGEQGSTATEFAVIVIPFLLFLMCIVDGGRVFNTWVDLTHYTRQAARYGVAYQTETEAGTGSCFSGDTDCANASAAPGWNASCAYAASCWQSNLQLLVATYAVDESGGLLTSSNVPVTVTMDAEGFPSAINVKTSYNVRLLTPVLEKVTSGIVPLGTEAQMRAE